MVPNVTEVWAEFVSSTVGWWKMLQGGFGRFVTFGVEFRGSSLKVFVELIERLKNLCLCNCKPSYLIEEVSEAMFADIARSTGLFPEVVRLLDFSVRVPTGHNDAILSSQSSRG
jgi:hypothetical protein